MAEFGQLIRYYAGWLMRVTFVPEERVTILFRSACSPPLRPSHVRSIRTKLQIERKKRDLALFNLAIDSKLRGGDMVAVRVDDVALSGCSTDRATIRQKKTGRPVRFEISDQTRQAIDEYLRLTWRKAGQFLFAGRADDSARGLTTRQYARLVLEGVQHRARPGKVRHAFASTHEGGAHLPTDRKPQSGPTIAQSHGILPANTRWKPRSTIRSILNSVRPL